MCIRAQLYGRAVDCCKEIPKEVSKSADGCAAILNALYKCDPLSVVSEVYKDFTELLDTRRNTNESYRGFESRLAARVSKFSANGELIRLHESMTSVMFISNAGVSDS